MLFCLDISCILIIRLLIVYLHQGTCIFNPLILLSWERFEIFCCCIFRKAKLAFYINTNCKGSGNRNPGSGVCFNVECVLRLGNASEFTCVSNLKWFRNVTHWPKESVTETSPPIWYAVRLLNKNHIIENILEEQIKTTDIWQDSEVLIFLVKSAQLQEPWELLKFNLCPLSHTFYLTKLWVELFHCLVHTHFITLHILATSQHPLYPFHYLKDWELTG